MMNGRREEEWIGKIKRELVVEAADYFAEIFAAFSWGSGEAHAVGLGLGFVGLIDPVGVFVGLMSIIQEIYPEIIGRISNWTRSLAARSSPPKVYFLNKQTTV